MCVCMSACARVLMLMLLHTPAKSEATAAAPCSLKWKSEPEGEMCEMLAGMREVLAWVRTPDVCG